MLYIICNLHLVGQNSGVATHELILAQFGYEAGLQSGDVTALFQDSRGTFWVGTRAAGIFQFNQARFISIPEINQNIDGEISGICESLDGKLVINTTTSTFLFDGRVLEVAKSQRQQCDDLITVPHLNGEESILCELEQGLGAYWVGTNKGLRSFNPVDTLWQFYSDVLGLLDDAVQALMYDHNNVLWIGTRTNGLLQYVGLVSQSPDIILAAKPQIAKSNPVASGLSILGEDGHMYSMAMSTGLQEINAFDSLRIENFFVDCLGRYWLEKRDGLIEIVNANYPDSIISNINIERRILSFACDRFNTVWIEAKGGILFRGILSEDVGPPDLSRLYTKLPNDACVQLIPFDQDMAFRIGSRSVGVIRNDRYSTIYESDTQILCAYRDDSGILWIGTDGNGIIKLKEGKQGHFVQLPEFWRGAKIMFLHKKESVLWVGTDKAVYQLSLDYAQRGVLRGTRILSLPRASLESENFIALAEDAIGVISDKNIYLLKTQGFTLPVGTPRVFISGVNLRDMALSESKYKSTTAAYAKQLQPLSLSYSENTLTMHWQGLSTATGNLTYSYRLNSGEAWSSPTNRTALQLAEMAPGEYYFDVKVCDEKGNCSTLESPWIFEIRKALWHNWWFWTILCVMALFAITSLVKYREKKIKFEAADRLQFVKAKLQAVELEQKAMQLQMNPHFIFNAIQTIHHQLLNNESRNAANSLISFSSLMRAMLEMSRTDKVSLEDELDFLNAYVLVEKICRASPIEFVVGIADDVELFDTMIPSMMLQPIIENAIKYGGSYITFDIRRKGKYLQFKICDNGSGFPEDVLKKGDSVALTLLKERIAHMPGNGWLKYFNISEDGNVTGACVELYFLE